jgi:Outer membrane protein beta-barrel domain
MVDLWFSLNEFPEKAIKGGPFLFHLEIRASIGNERMDFKSIADDAFIHQQLLNACFRVPSHFLGVKMIKRFSVIFPLVEDRLPTQTGLGALKIDQLKERAIIVEGNSPLLVMILNIKRVTQFDPSTSIHCIEIGNQTGRRQLPKSVLDRVPYSKICRSFQSPGKLIIMRPILILLLTLLAITAFADDTVTLKNGKEVKGKILSETDSVVLFQTPSGKRYRLDKSQIKGLTHGAERTPASDSSPSVAEKVEVPAAEATYIPSSIGLLLGPSFSSMSGSTAATQSVPLSGQTGFAFGITSEMLPIWEFVYFQPELLYEQLGAAFSASGVTGNLYYNVLRLPLLAKAKGNFFDARSPLQFVGFAGPSLAFLLSSGINATAAGVTATTAAPNINSFDLGLEFGVGAEYALDKRFAVLLNLRYDLGLSNVSSDPNGSVSSRDFQILAGLSYHL